MNTYNYKNINNTNPQFRNDDTHLIPYDFVNAITSRGHIASTYNTNQIPAGLVAERIAKSFLDDSNNKVDCDFSGLITQSKENNNAVTPSNTTVPNQPPAYETHPNITNGALLNNTNYMSSFEKQRINNNAKRDLSSNAYIIVQEMISIYSFYVKDDELYCYDGTYYVKKSTSDVKRMIIELQRDKIAKNPTSKFVENIYYFLINEPVLLKKQEKYIDNCVPFKNSILDLSNNHLYPHTPNILNTYCINCDFNSQQVETPIWDSFLYSITGNDTILMNRIMEMIGYILTPDTKGKCFFLLQGCPNSGKSILCELLRSFFDETLLSALDVHSLSEPFAASELKGKMLCTSPDLPSGKLDEKSVSKLKQFTGGDLICANVKNKPRVQFKCNAKFVLATNHLFLINGKDEAFFQRIITIPFNFSIPRERQNPYLLEKLKNEKSGIATKAIEAYKKLRCNNYRFSGKYQINTAWCLLLLKENINIETLIYSFLMNNYEYSQDSVVYVSDALELFQQMYTTISYNKFSKYFTDTSEKLYCSTKSKTRKTPSANPTNSATGIRRKLQV